MSRRRSSGISLLSKSGSSRSGTMPGIGLQLFLGHRLSPDAVDRFIPRCLDDPGAGKFGYAEAGHWSTAAAKASCADSSARSKSPTMPIRVATIRPQSER